MATLRDNLVEAIVGLLVVLLAVWFFVFAWQRTGGGMEDSIRVTALFPAANGVSIGTDVKLAGLKVGSVAGQRLDPETYQAEVTLAIDEDVSIPSDSSAAITAEGLLGGTFIVLLPGGSPTPLKDGDMIFDTQGSVDMMGLIGSFINRSGGPGASPPADTGSPGLGTMEEPAAQ
ncbi:outer membrane lipid asymmetry maintenance protein MlaD [Allosphingosinicella sp.]|uniref:outer membrane lipid asymmetry maintenance protein MlaD n=1 Tax=Allosphingosinicella sp. TaxID=2823234 RepID=UPI002FC22572